MIFASAIGNWWDGLFVLQQVTFILACAASVLLVVQLIAMLFGLGDDADFDADTDISGADDIFNDNDISDAGGLRLVSFRTVVAFIAVGGWITYTMNFFLPWYFSLIIGVIAGAAAAVGVAYLLKAILKFQSDGNRHMSFAVGAIADVYLTVPPLRNGSGKIHVVVQETLTECEAVTDSPDPIPTGARCVVKEVINEQLVLVEPFTALKQDRADGVNQ